LENAPAARTEAVMSDCLTCSKPFGSNVAVGNFWWSQSYCSNKCAEDDAKKIQDEELKKQHLVWLSPNTWFAERQPP
jgi:hypothetical protein